MRGRPPKPDELKAAQGNPGHRPIAEPEQQAESAPVSQGAPPPPFLKSDRERELWTSVGRLLHQLAFVKATDHAALGRWCKYMVQWIAVSEQIGDGELTYETDSKHGRMLRLRPQFLAQGLLERRILALEDRLGLTPIARQQIMRALATGLQNPGDMFGAEKPASKKPDAPAPVQTPSSSPIGLLNVGGRPN